MSASSPKQCSVDGCGEPPRGRGLCSAHYQAAWKRGTLGEHEPQRWAGADQSGFACPPDHKHAESTTCYIQHRCRCDSCRTGVRVRSRTRRKDHAYGRFDGGLVDAHHARQHLQALSEFGIGYKRAASLAGVSATAVRTILYGRQDPGPRKGEMPQRVKRTTSEALLAVKPDISLLAPGALVPARGTHRRVQALVTIGWSLSKLGAHLGIDPSNFAAMMARTQVTVKLHLEVAALFEELWATPPAHDSWAEKSAYSRALNHARARRWLPPLAWDDIDLDEEPPAADGEDDAVDETAIGLAIAGEAVRLTPLERRECVRRLHRERWSDGRVAETLRCNPRTVLRIREELGLPAWDQNDLRDRAAA